MLPSKHLRAHSLHTCSVGLAEKFMSLTFRRKIDLHMFRDEFVVTKRFLMRAVHIPKLACVASVPVQSERN